MKFSKVLLIKLTVFSLLTFNVHPIDLPIAYRATEIQGLTKYQNVKDWMTFVEGRYRGGRTRKGYTGNNDTTSILNIYGLVDFNNLASNLEGLNATSMPKTYEYLRVDGGIIPNQHFTGDNGKIKLTGKASVDEFNLELQQNVANGFFAKAYIPFRSLKISEIAYEDQTMTWTTGYDAFHNFLTSQDFDTVLDENGYLPLSTTFKKSSVGDINFCVGWQGYGKDVLNYFSDIYGYAEVGVVFPVAKKQELNNIAARPLGYNNHIGVDGRISINLKPFKILDFGVHGEAIILFGKKQLTRLKTDKSQSGLITLQKAYADTNPGTIWGFGGNITVMPWIKGLFIRGAYSFSRQEKTILTVKDDNYLKSVLATENANTTDRTNQNDVANSDDRLNPWSQHVVHGQVGFDVRDQTNAKIAPKFVLSYDYPFYGKRVFKTAMAGGTIGLSILLDF